MIMTIDLAANLAQILTAVVAAGAAILFWGDRLRKKWRLEAYLRKEIGSKIPKHTVLHLMAAACMFSQ